MGCPEKPKRLETLSMSIGPFWHRMLAEASELEAWSSHRRNWFGVAIAPPEFSGESI